LLKKYLAQLSLVHDLKSLLYACNLLEKAYGLLSVYQYLAVVGSQWNPKNWFLKADYI
jgi:hypothetical protein